MKNEQPHDTQGQKRPYQKPALSQIPLRPEEAVLGSCKTSSGSGGPAGISGCSSASVSCFTHGS